MTQQKIIEIMRNVFRNDAIDITCSQQNCNTWDSINHINLIVELEIAFNVSFEPEEISSMTDFKRVMDTLNNKLHD